MDRVLVLVFDQADKAFEGRDALKSLDPEDDLTRSLAHQSRELGQSTKALLISFARACSYLDRLLDSCGISQIVMPNGLEVVVQLLHLRHSGGDVEVHDLLIRDVLQVLQQRPQAISMGRN